MSVKSFKMLKSVPMLEYCFIIVKYEKKLYYFKKWCAMMLKNDFSNWGGR
jgi:hypothetical protein